MIPLSTISYCLKQCTNRTAENADSDKACKEYGTIPEAQRRGVLCPKWSFAGEEP